MIGRIFRVVRTPVTLLVLLAVCAVMLGTILTLAWTGGRRLGLARADRHEGRDPHGHPAGALGVDHVQGHHPGDQQHQRRHAGAVPAEAAPGLARQRFVPHPRRCGDDAAGLNDRRCGGRASHTAGPRSG